MIRTLLFLFALCLAVASIQALARSDSHKRSFLEHSEPLPLPAGWKRVSQESVADSSAREVKLVFAVKQRNLDVLEESFWAVSNPKNARYGKHLNLNQLSELVGPSEQSVKAITQWLDAEDVTRYTVTQAGEFIRVSVSTETASRVFAVDFHTYKHSSGLVSDVAVGPYSVPSHVAPHLDLVSGLVGFPDIRYKRPSLSASLADRKITPDVIRARYNITDLVTTPNPNNAQAVAEFQAEYYSASDLKIFYEKFVTNAPYQDIAKIIGTNVPKQPGDEASLDVQYIMGVVPNITTWFYSLKSDAFWNDLLVWTSEIANETSPPWVHSVSYGSQGDYPSAAYRERLNAEFQKAGLRGISIIFASGDDGSGCETGAKPCKCEMFPSFPATCPYVTSVGATAFIDGNTGEEKAVSAFLSGGGFSQEFPTTQEQNTAVQNYLNSGVALPPSCSYNASGRGTPDVGALGDIEFQVVQSGSVGSIGGTSASAPTFAAIVTLLNEQLLNKNKPTLGFLNPWIYDTASSHPDAFFDVVKGSNIVADCCGRVGNGGFLTAAGWDPITGVGTPNYQVLASLL